MMTGVDRLTDEVDLCLHCSLSLFRTSRIMKRANRCVSICHIIIVPRVGININNVIRVEKKLEAALEISWHSALNFIKAYFVKNTGQDI